MKDLLEVVNNLISLKELNPIAITHDPNHSWKHNNVPVELQNTDKKSSEITITSVEEEWK